MTDPASPSAAAGASPPTPVPTKATSFANAAAALTQAQALLAPITPGQRPPNVPGMGRFSQDPVAAWVSIAAEWRALGAVLTV